MEKPFTPRDVRGIYPSQVNEELFYKIGRAIPQVFNLKKIVIGRDHRLSSDSLSDSLISGLIKQGVEVIDLGFTTSPTISIYAIENKIMSIMITASHNPKEYNGLKFGASDGNYIMYDDGIDKIEELVNKNIFFASEIEGIKNIVDFNSEYCSYLRNFIRKSDKKIKIAVDTGNGVGGPIIEEIFKNVENIEIVPLFFEADGNYPNHDADPSKEENISDLKKTIVEKNCDFGVAFDGDCDRCKIIDENANILGSEEFLCIAAKFEENSNFDKIAYFDIWFSQSVKDFLKNIDYKFEALPMGAGNYRRALLEKGGTLASEFSGHIFFKENYCVDDGFFAFIKAINYYLMSDEKYSKLREGILKWKSVNKNYRVDDAQNVIDRIVSNFSNGRISRIDGVTIEFDDFWFNIRCSLTEPIIRMKVEAKNNKILDNKLSELENIILI